MDMDPTNDFPPSFPSLSADQLHRILKIFSGVLFSLVQRPDGTYFFTYISEAAATL